jgi:S1-C subfamily serine protease
LLHSWEREGEGRALERLAEHRQRAGQQLPPSLRRSLEGMLGYVAMIRGPRDELVQRLKERLHMVTGGPLATDAVWVIESDSTSVQGTGFLARDWGLITCDHVLRDDSVAKRHNNHQEYRLLPIHRNRDLDLAVCQFAGADITDFHALELSPRIPQVRDRVELIGFPNHAPGRTPTRAPGDVLSQFPRHGADCFGVSCTVVRGNSGGPLLDREGRVVGVARFGRLPSGDPSGENIGVSTRMLERLRAYDAGGNYNTPRP